MPNRDVWEGAVLSGTNQRRCVKPHEGGGKLQTVLFLRCKGVLGDLAQNPPTRAFALKRKNHQTTNGRNPKE
ncbi:hypothetical protein A9G03_10805 [Gilliamella sp. wkB171]|nr:hypothetical protein A9G03_10805 [Gilliamella apicola]